MGKKNRPNKRHEQNKHETDGLAEILGTQAPEVKEPEPTQSDEVNPLTEGGEIVQPTAESPTAIAEPAETEKPAEPEKPTEATNLEEVLRKLAESIPDEALRLKAISEVSKLYQQDATTKQAKGWVKFDEDFKPAVEKLITELTEKHGLKPENQKITILFPDGKPSYSRGLKGKGSSSNGNRTGFPAGWGKSKAGEQEFNSPSKMAESLGCIVNGKGAGYSDMVDVFDKQGHAVLELPKGPKLDELLAKQTNPERRERLEKLGGTTFRVAV